MSESVWLRLVYFIVSYAVPVTVIASAIDKMSFVYRSFVFLSRSYYVVSRYEFIGLELLQSVLQVVSVHFDRWVFRNCLEPFLLSKQYVLSILSQKVVTVRYIRESLPRTAHKRISIRSLIENLKQLYGKRFTASGDSPEQFGSLVVQFRRFVVAGVL